MAGNATTPQLQNLHKFSANDWIQLLELLNKVWGLGLVLLLACSGGAYELLFKAWFRRGDCAFGLKWFASVVLHDSWWLVLSF